MCRKSIQIPQGGDFLTRVIGEFITRVDNISDYAVQDNLHLEYWAEMVAVWVYGKSYTDTALGGNSTALTVDQRNWVAHVLSGWGW